LTFFLEKGTCDSPCPKGIINITGQTSGEVVFPSSGNYGANETKCWRIEVLKPYEGIGIYFHYFEIEECLDCECDYLSITRDITFYRFESVLDDDCGRKSTSYQKYLLKTQGKMPSVQPNGRDIYVRFVSDGSVHYRGFNFSFIAESDREGPKSFLNASEDETIEFGTPKVGIKNYPANFAWQWFLIVPEGRRVQITFDTFELERSKNCTKDYVEVREAFFEDPNNPSSEIRGDFGAILAKSMCGSTKPNPIQSTGNMVWVQFVSDSNTTTTYKGFKASFTAAVDGGFTEWGLWEPCSSSCGPGSQSRTRNCTNPPPNNHGNDCEGPRAEIQGCISGPCPVDGGYTEWGPWGPCSSSCGLGIQVRHRNCTNPLPSNHGNDCVGQRTEIQGYNSGPCPVLGSDKGQKQEQDNTDDKSKDNTIRILVCVAIGVNGVGILLLVGALIYFGRRLG